MLLSNVLKHPTLAGLVKLVTLEDSISNCAIQLPLAAIYSRHGVTMSNPAVVVFWIWYEIRQRDLNPTLFFSLYHT